MGKRVSYEAKMDAYNNAIAMLCEGGMECAYDDEGDYAAGRIWLAKRLEGQIDKIIRDEKLRKISALVKNAVKSVDD
ncbi:MAG TPA: hypothetical protein VJ327_10970 [Patescibacteria group bacterium]|nr:hypothetical protein [Patescibacteria group bacterium]